MEQSLFPAFINNGYIYEKCDWRNMNKRCPLSFSLGIQVRVPLAVRGDVAFVEGVEVGHVGLG